MTIERLRELMDYAGISDLHPDAEKSALELLPDNTTKDDLVKFLDRYFLRFVEWK